MLRYDVHGVLSYVGLCCAMLRSVVLFSAILCHVALCCVMLRWAVLWYVALCCAKKPIMTLDTSVRSSSRREIGNPLWTKSRVEGGAERYSHDTYNPWPYISRYEAYASWQIPYWVLICIFSPQVRSGQVRSGQVRSCSNKPFVLVWLQLSPHRFLSSSSFKTSFFSFKPIFSPTLLHTLFQFPVHFVQDRWRRRDRVHFSCNLSIRPFLASG